MNDWYKFFCRMWISIERCIHSTNKQTNSIFVCFRCFIFFQLSSFNSCYYLFIFVEKNDTIFFLSLHYYYDYEFNNWNSLVGRKKSGKKLGSNNNRNKKRMNEWHLHTLVDPVDRHFSLSLFTLFSLSFYAWFRQNQFVNYLFIHSEWWWWWLKCCNGSFEGNKQTNNTHFHSNKKRLFLLFKIHK